MHIAVNIAKNGVALTTQITPRAQHLPNTQPPLPLKTGQGVVEKQHLPNTQPPLPLKTRQGVPEKQH